jgi:hypothetical protein
MRPPMSQLFFCHFKHEIRGESVRISSNLLFQPFRLDAVKIGQVAVQHNLDPAQGMNAMGNLRDCNQLIHRYEILLRAGAVDKSHFQN